MDHSISSINISNDHGSQGSMGSEKTESAPLIASKRNVFGQLRNYLCGSTSTSSTNQRTLGTMSGVFAPVALSQFSTLLFLRIGFIVGSLGIIVGSLTFVLAYVILAFTILSICAISTNGAIEGGGAYFMISRTLGAEFGGAIGILFFLANVSSSALYISGCVEGILQFFGENAGTFAIAKILPEGEYYEYAYGSCINFFNLLVCFIGARLFAKFTVAILFTVGMCTCFVFSSYWVHPTLVHIPATNELHFNETGAFTGISLTTAKSNLYPDFVVDYTTGEQIDFATVFGVLFSGVTGIMAGANMSGELEAPGKNIPKGTIGASLFTLIVYLLLVWFTGFSCSRFLLQNNYSFMMAINVWPPLICLGVFMATLSASLSNMIGASRVLAAVIKDNIYGKLLRWIGQLHCGSNPIGALILSALLVQCALMIGQLNTIAKITSVFFLVSYMATNLACMGLTWASAPNFRPTFKYFSIYTAVAGIGSSLVMMFMISVANAGLCILFCICLVIGLHFKSPENDWGSISQALIYHQVRKYLLLLDNRKDHVKFWRPQILLMVADPRSACPLIDFVNDLKKSGLYILGHVKIGHYNGDGEDPAAIDIPKWQFLIDHLKVKAFSEVIVAPSVRIGTQHLVRIAGLGAMKPNIVILGFYDDAQREDFFIRETTPYHVNPDGKEKILSLLKRDSKIKRIEVLEYVAMMNDLLNMKKDLVLCRHFHLLDKMSILKDGIKICNTPFIDIWPMNFFDPTEKEVFDQSSLFLMQLSTVLNMVSTWSKKTRLRVFVCLTDPLTSFEKKAEVTQILNDLRMKATIDIVSWGNISSLFKKTELPLDEAIGTGAPIRQITDYSHLSDNYLKGVNQMIREHSDNTAVTFMFLPRPPSDSSHYDAYMRSLAELTDQLHPTILVHGVSKVTTTNI